LRIREIYRDRERLGSFEREREMLGSFERMRANYTEIR